MIEEADLKFYNSGPFVQSITLINANQSNSASSSDCNFVESWLESIYTNGVTDITYNFFQLENIISYTFKNKKLLQQALTHTSYTHESMGKLSLSNERLEFLGDSIVNLIVTAELYEKYPQLSEGELSKLRGALVNENKFFELASVLSLSKHIFVGKGEWKQKGNQRASLLADAFEALIAAIYLDSKEDIAEVKRVFLTVLSHYTNHYKEDYFNVENLIEFDFKTQLQELCVAMYQVTPRYQSEETNGSFNVSLYLKDQCLHKLQGSSKKKLEKELAKIVLKEKKYLYLEKNTGEL